MVPTVLFPPVMPSTVQRTAVLVVPLTVLVNCCVWVKVSPTVRGRTLTVTCALALIVRRAKMDARSRRRIESSLIGDTDWNSNLRLRLASDPPYSSQKPHFYCASDAQ